jgi:4-hydroxy-4-methyl-2-oxoglutarate aldolase
VTKELTEAQLAELRAWPSPAISNAIETFNVRSRNTGFMGPEIVCRFPEMPPIVGYAVTCKIRASIPPGDDPESVAPPVWWEHIESIPAPRIVVIQDMDQPPRGSFWGEVNGNIHKALGCIGLITDGGVRDLDEVREIGFQFLAKELLVSHAYVHIVEVGKPVTVGGLTVAPGDLLHADQHGAINIPHEIAPDVAAAAQAVEDRERVIINYAKSPEFSRQGLMELMGGRAPASKQETP